MKNNNSNSIVYDHKHAIPKNAFTCKPINGKCDVCRACWDSKVKTICYIKH
jgi:hypothetical protein